MRDNSFGYNVCQLNLYRENKGIRRIMVASGGGLIKAILAVAIKLVDGGQRRDDFILSPRVVLLSQWPA